MSVESFINRVILRDTAVYWDMTDSNPDGTVLYGQPIEIGCTWKKDIRRIKDFWEKEVASRAQIYVGIDLIEQGMLYHGKLVDLSEEEKATPSLIPNAFEIRRFQKTPSLYLPNKFMRKAYV